LPDAVVHGFELTRAEHIEAALLPSGDDDAAAEILTELGGEDDAALVIELRRVRSQQHDLHPLFVRPVRVSPHFTPLRSTFLWQSAFRPEYGRISASSFRGITRLSQRGARVEGNGALRP